MGKVSSSSPWGEDGDIGSNYQSLAAQQIFKSTIPTRSWDVYEGFAGDSGNENQTHSWEEMVRSAFDGNAWAMPRPTIERDKS